MSGMQKNPRLISIVAFSFLFAHLLAFLFEGQVLYSLLNIHGLPAPNYIFTAIVAHLAGLLTGGFFVKTPLAAKNTMLSGMGICFIAAVPFFFMPSAGWLAALLISGYASGCAVASWGYFLKAFTPKNERIKSCADVLICSNLLMIAVNVVALNISSHIGLTLSLLCLIIGMAFTYILPLDNTLNTEQATGDKNHNNIGTPLLLLCLFIFVITINSGLMYQVINPAFEHLTGLVSWYWAIPYIVALAIMRNLPVQVKRSNILYAGMTMIMGTFISFMLLGRNVTDYLLIDTLMLGACGIFDLFWWSILGEMLDYTENPAQVLGRGLSANVAGVLCGGVLGLIITGMNLPDSEVAVIALTIVCVTLVMLPPLNQQLVLLLKNHAYLNVYGNMTENQQAAVLHQVKSLNPLTVREQEVLQQILSGQSNREIAAALFISESTVKTHVRNIFSKYDVGSRAELISTLLKNQTGK